MANGLLGPSSLGHCRQARGFPEGKQLVDHTFTRKKQEETGRLASLSASDVVEMEQQ